MPLTLQAQATSACPYNPFAEEYEVAKTTTESPFDANTFASFLPLQPIPFRFTESTTSADLRVHLDVSDLPKELRKKALTSRIDTVTQSPSFQVSVLAKRSDLRAFEALLNDKLLQNEKAHAGFKSLLRFVGIKRGNFAKLEAAREVILLAKAHRTQNNLRLDTALSTRPINLEFIAQLVAEGAEVNPSRILQKVSKAENAPLIALLAKASSDINYCDELGITALRQAAANGHVAIVQALLSAGASVHLADKTGYNPIDVAAKHGHVQVIKLLIAAGADPNHACQRGWRPLHLAAREGHTKAIEALIAAKANINQTKDGGETPLDVATRCHLEDTIKVLLAAGARQRQSGLSR